MQIKKAALLFTVICILVFTYNSSFAVPNKDGTAASGPSSQTDFGKSGSINSVNAAMEATSGISGSAPVPDIGAPSAIIMEAESGQVLYSKDTEKALHISAACKLMTVLVAIENADITSNVTVSSESAGTEGSALSLEAGAKYPLDELLYAIMLTSANDAAIAVAEHVAAGDQNKFVELMNKTAEKLKMTNTHFSNPTGLFDENQFTTAGDIALLIKYAIGNTTFNRMFTVKVRPWYYSGNEAKIMTSSNKLFWEYDGIEGGKTGYNKKEQQSIITTAFRNQLRLICVVLDSPEKTMYADASVILDYSFRNFKKSILVRKGEVLKTAEYDGNEVNLISQNDVSYVHPVGESYIKEFSAIADLKSPIKKTLPAGTASYVLQDGTVINVSLYPESEIIPPESIMTQARKKIMENRDIFILILLLLAIEVLLIIYNIGKLIKKLIIFISRRVKHQKRNG